MQAAPSQAELLFQQYKTKKEALTGQTKNSILDKYGDASEKEVAPEGLLMGQTEHFMEYDRAGQGLTLVEFSAQLEPCLTQQSTQHTPNTP